MMIKIKQLFSSLSFKISAIFLLVLLVFGSCTLYISIKAANDYSHEVNQHLNDSLATTTAQMIQPHIKNGELDEEAIEDLVHSMMVINPIVEIYILNSDGIILDYVAPNKVVKLDKVSTNPIENFINRSNPRKLIYGDDPRTPGKKKIFSAAPLYGDNGFSGYIYIVLASQLYESTAQTMLDSYILSVTTRSLVIILIITALVGLLIIWLLTTNLRTIIHGIRKFREGDLKARITTKGDTELDKVAMTFNEMANTIEKNIEALKGLDKLRKELITNISHDLKTPIASIKGYAETLALKKESLSAEESSRYLQIVINSSEKLERLVDELFELSKLETGQIAVHREPFSIVELIQDIANKYRLISQEKGINLDIVLSKNISLVDADIALIDRALQNLIDNAIKFCKTGDTVTIEVKETNTGDITIYVNDSGPGIPSAELSFIFDRYYKGPRTENRVEGTGLGLAIVKKIMDLHGVVINVDSQIRRGTRFYFSLPSSNYL